MKLLRRDVVRTLARSRGDAAIISGLGAATYDCAAAGDSPLNFYLWGGMGGAAPLALGVAMARPTRRVVVVTGDGEVLMGLGSLAVIGAQAPPNLAVLVLDNEAFGETGRQGGLTAGPVDIAAMARGAGFARAWSISHPREVDDGIECLLKEAGPVLVVAKVALSDDPVALPSRDGPFLVDRFRAALDQ